MGRPSTRQVAEAIVQSARAGESEAKFDVRYAGLSRLSDAEFVAMGIHPRPQPKLSRPRPELVEGTCPELVEGTPKLTKLTTPRIGSVRACSPRSAA